VSLSPEQTNADLAGDAMAGPGHGVAPRPGFDLVSSGSEAGEIVAEGGKRVS
jgi:hypothetical protein